MCFYTYKKCRRSSVSVSVSVSRDQVRELRKRVITVPARFDLPARRCIVSAIRIFDSSMTRDTFCINLNP